MGILLNILLGFTASTVIDKMTDKPAITITNEGESVSETMQDAYKWGFYIMLGFVATMVIKKVVK